MSQEMTAIRFHEYGGSDRLLVEKILRPQPKAGEVLIKVHFAGSTRWTGSSGPDT